ncbi:MAG: hypothetical protein JNN04_09975 [Cyclobacteriaceae bacterium]|nr:hypothetical protein [Cyclobacteriaceae bacterium]
MKIFIIFALFLLASVLPILFVPLLALTLITLAILAPELLTHHVWGTKEEDREEEARHAHH